MAIMEAVYYKNLCGCYPRPGTFCNIRRYEGTQALRKMMMRWQNGSPAPILEKDLQESSEKMAATFTWDRCADAFLQASSEKSSR